MTTAIETTAPAGTLAEIEHQLAIDPRLKSDKTRRAYRADLAAFERWRGLRPFSKLLVEEYAAGLQAAQRAPAGINRVLAALRWWARRLSELVLENESLSDADRRRVSEQALRVALVQDVKGTRPPKGRHLAPGELAGLLNACVADRSAAGTRDAALIGMAWATGLRVSELAGLTLGRVHLVAPDDYDLTVQGKGDKARAAYLNDGAGAALSDWLALRGPGAPGELVFVAIDQRGTPQRELVARGLRAGGTQLTAPSMGTSALSKMLVRRAEQAQLSQPVTWHDFRRSFAGNLLDNGVDLATVQKLMGHSSPDTTSGYDRRGDESKRRAVRTLHVPYKHRQP